MSSSILTIFKIGIGPSSSHTVGPVVMGNYFCNEIKNINQVTKIKIDLYGSLSFTGKGHLTDLAIVIGLSGLKPDNITSQDIEIVKQRLKNDELLLKNKKIIKFSHSKDIVFNKTYLSLHENAMTITAYENDNKILEKTYFSIGGGFVKDKENFFEEKSKKEKLPIDFSTAEELLNLCTIYNKNISEISLIREMQINTKEYIYDYYIKIWDTMRKSIENGLQAEDILPGILSLKRRAKQLYIKLIEEEKNIKEKDDFYTINWLTAFSLAVSEENASGHQVVTAPTNGACAIVPAVLAYYDKFHKKLDEETIVRFLLTASAIGYIYKTNASISGAEAGCQAEIGAASSMAAVAIAEIFGATPSVACAAGEIAMEHHLGLTCDPIAGLVQIPCIERNSFGAVKAVMAAKMAINRITKGVINLDQVIRTMYATGKDMNKKYKETSKGGLAKIVKQPNCT